MPRGPRGPVEKPKDRKKVLLRIWTYIYAHKWMALGAVLLTAGMEFAVTLPCLLLVFPLFRQIHRRTTVDY